MQDDGGVARQAPPVQPRRPASWAPPPDRGTELSPEVADRVIRRALELHDQDRRLTAARMSARDLEEVVAELGIPRAYVGRALEDVLVSGPAHLPSQVERLFAPRRVGAGRLVEGTRQQAHAAVATWMRDDEGLELRGRRHDGERWSKDRRVQAAVRHGLKLGRGSGELRRLPGVTVRVSEVAEGRQLVEVEADTSPVTATGVGVGVAGVAGGAVAGTLSAALLGDGVLLGSDVLQAAAGFLPVAGAGLLTARAAARRWAGRVRRAVDGALDGISLVTAGGATAPAQAPTDWRTIARDVLGRWR